MLVLSMAMVSSIGVNAQFTPPSTPPNTWMWVENHTVVEKNELVGTTFDINVNIFNVSRLAGWQFRVDYDNTLLKATWTALTTISLQYNTHLLPTPWNETKGINHPSGYVTFAATYPNDPDNPFSGSGSLLKITFEIISGPGYEQSPPAPPSVTVSCDLDLSVQACDWIDTNYDVYAVNPGVQDGYYEWERPQKAVGAPTAVSSVSPTTQYVGQDVTFDGTGSDDGGAPPMYYAWDVGSDGSYEYNSTSVTVSYTCVAAGTYNVTLTVTNNADMSDDATIKYWTVIEKLGPIIDLYTSTNRWCGVDTDPDKVGKGKDMPCDALSPDVNITLFAEVTYNGAPVNHVFVAFEVLWEWEVDWYDQQKDPVLHNSCVLFATAETNKAGIAQISFRVPTSCDNKEYIGKWFAMAKCKVQEVPIEDTMRFDVGYLVMMYGIQTLKLVGQDYVAGDTYIREIDYLGVTISVKSIAWIPRNALFILVAYDECNVPLDQVLVNVQVPPGYYCSPEHTDFTITGLDIPQWAYVGKGRVEVSAFTAVPHDCGVAYSKPISALITIDWSTP